MGQAGLSLSRAFWMGLSVGRLRGLPALILLFLNRRELGEGIILAVIGINKRLSGRQGVLGKIGLSQFSYKKCSRLRKFVGRASLFVWRSSPVCRKIPVARCCGEGRARQPSGFFRFHFGHFVAPLRLRVSSIWSDSSLFFISSLFKTFPSFCKGGLQNFLVLFSV